MANPAEQRSEPPADLPTRVPFAGPHPGTGRDWPPAGQGQRTRAPLPRAAAAFRRQGPPVGATPQTPAEPLTAPPPAAKPLPRYRILTAAAAIAVLVAGAVWWSQDRTPPPAPQAAAVPTDIPTVRITAPGDDAGIGGSASAGGSAPPSRSPAPSKSASSKPSAKPVDRVPVKAKANAAGRNLALDGRATASGTEGEHWSPANAIDNDTATRWSSAFSDPQWLTVDLGASWQISEILLRWENAHATAYRVDLSVDGKSWKQVYSTTQGQGGDVTVQVPKTPARLVRMYGTKRSTDYGYSLLEIEVR